MNADEYGRMLVGDCRAELAALLPFERINAQPALEWIAQNVRQHQGLP